ncbi:hypothetical protein SAMN04244547_04262 [Azotobacter vinelandii]|nr:hypothetical protein SAMN04244547_04262 [Azotobacter vinelandii]
MSEIMVKPLRSYMDRGVIRKAGGGEYPTPAHLARQLEARGLCRIVEPEHPKTPAGESPSASPAAQASLPKTVSESANGDQQRRRERSSAQTQRSD